MAGSQFSVYYDYNHHGITNHGTNDKLKLPSQMKNVLNENLFNNIEQRIQSIEIDTNAKATWSQDRGSYNLKFAIHDGNICASLLRAVNDTKLCEN